MISRNRLPSWASAAAESPNAGQSGTDAPSRRASSAVTSAPISRPSAAKLRPTMSGYSACGCAASSRAGAP